MLTRKVTLVISCSLLLLGVLGVRNFLSSTAGESGKFSERLAVEVQEKRRHANVAKVRLKDLTDFTWDKVHLFNPYTSTEKIDEDLGYAWPPAHSIGLYQRDDISLMVFTNNGKVVSYVEQPRHPVDAKGNYKQGGYNPDEAVFEVVERGKMASGLPHVFLKWQGEE